MALAVERPVFIMAKESLFRIPLLSWWLHSMGFFPVARVMGDKRAFENAREVLRGGNVLATAPEGTRQRKGPGRPSAHTGIVRLAQEFRCPVVPVGVRGTRKALPPGGLFPRPCKLSVTVGQPIHLEPIEVIPENRHRLQEQVDFIMDKIYQLSGENFLSGESVHT